MVRAEYLHEIPYTVDERTGRRFPRLLVRLVNPQDEKHAFDTDAFVDTGTEKSVFGSYCAVAIGLSGSDGSPYSWSTSAGGSFSGRLHPVRLLLHDIGEFDLELGFKEEGGIRDDLRRNLLGRDFLDQIQIGFREHHQVFFIPPTP